MAAALLASAAAHAEASASPEPASAPAAPAAVVPAAVTAVAPPPGHVPAHSPAPAAAAAAADPGSAPDPAAVAAADELIQRPDDPASQAAMDRGAAELAAVRRAEQKAGLLPTAPGAGPRDSLSAGLPAWDPLARDLDAALGSSIDGAPLRNPVAVSGGAVSLPELTGISAEELRAKYDIPVELNDAVIAYIRFFQTDAREHFAHWLSRSTKWLPTMRRLLEKDGVPVDLVYLSMIESGFNAYAYSWAKAAGLWQFMVGTSRRYGLVTDFWVDERRDPIKATVAAGQYLRDLKTRFHGDWYLAWAGYNAGEGKVDRAIRNESTTDFWRMMEKGRTLRAETKHYVPKLIAAALIAKHPERFGFSVQYEEPFDYDEAELEGAVDLGVIASAAGTSVERIRELNPELRRSCTPPTGWVVRLPKGTHDTFIAAFAHLDAKARLSFTQHKVEKGESLGKIARAYGVTEAVILRTNGLASHKAVKVGRVLVIPLAGTHGLLAGESLEDKVTSRRAQGRAGPTAPTASPSAAWSAVARAQARAGPDEPAVPAATKPSLAGPSAPAAGKRAASASPAPAALAKASATYRVRSGDSLWTIATKFGTTVDRLISLNRLSRRSARALQVGQTLAVLGDGARAAN